VVKNLMIEGLDRLGKDTLIEGIQSLLGYHQVLHYSKPMALKKYLNDLQMYQRVSFTVMFDLLNSYHRIICNRAHLGECVYAPLYRGYDGNYVFDIEDKFDTSNTRLILLTEDFKIARHFVDDGLSLGAIENREREQNMFIEAFEKSTIEDKRIICVTDEKLGGFKPKHRVLELALAA